MRKVLSGLICTTISRACGRIRRGPHVRRGPHGRHVCAPGFAQRARLFVARSQAQALHVLSQRDRVHQRYLFRNSARFAPRARSEAAPRSMATAATGSWSAFQLDPAVSANSLTAVSCPSSTQCTGVDDFGYEVTYNPSSTTAGSSQAPVLIDGSLPLNAVSCPSTTQCTAVDVIGNEVTFSPQSPGTPSPSAIDTDGGGFTAVSCPTTTICAGTDIAGNIVRFNPSTLSGTTLVFGGYTGTFTGISCPSATICALVDTSGRAWVTNPNIGSSQLYPDVVDPHNVLTAVSCAAVTSNSQPFCVTVDTAGNVITMNPSNFNTGRKQVFSNQSDDPAGGGFTGVSCVSDGRCVASDANGNEVAVDLTDQTTSGAPLSIDPNGGGLTDISCGPYQVLASPTTVECSAVDNNGYAATTAPQHATTPASTSLTLQIGPTLDDVMPSGDSVTAAVCPSDSECVAVDGDGDAVAVNPMAPGTPVPKVIDTSGAGLTSLACPAVTQCSAVDDGGNVITFNPQNVTVLTQSAIDPNGGGISGVACPSATLCTAVDLSGQVVTFNPQSPGSPTAVGVDTASDGLRSVACVSTTQCTAVDFNSGEVTFNPNSPGTPTVTAVDSSDQESSVACPAASECVAVDGNGNAVVFNPASPGSDLR
jgi:hypothetical protein